MDNKSADYPFRDHSYRFLICDRDSIFSTEVARQLNAFRVRMLCSMRLYFDGIGQVQGSVHEITDG
jgi:hypothetical protein